VAFFVVFFFVVFFFVAFFAAFFAIGSYPFVCVCVEKPRALRGA
jgi:hypothetical protein